MLLEWRERTPREKTRLRALCFSVSETFGTTEANRFILQDMENCFKILTKLKREFIKKEVAWQVKGRREAVQVRKLSMFVWVQQNQNGSSLSSQFSRYM